VLYKRAGRLFGDLSQARGEGRLPRLLTTLERVRLLIIVLRPWFESRLPQRAVARSLGLSQGAVSGYLSRARAVGIA
jgi:hypothetical protein